MTGQEKSSPFRSGYAVLVGRPNVGKSTLMNALLEEKLAIVTPRPQTTRQKVLGILNGERFQAVLLDTPGVLTPKYLLQQRMVKSVKKAVQDADVLVVLTEAGKSPEHEQPVLDVIRDCGAPKLLAINKIDTVKKSELLPAMAAFQALDVFRAIVPVSALHRDGMDDLIAELRNVLPVGRPFYPPDMLSSEPERFFAAEIVREKIFLRFREEIPYATAVHVETFREEPGRKPHIEAVITVERDSQKAILIGKGGQALKQVGVEARRDIERFLARPVVLKLVVRVRSKWRKSPRLLRQLGYE